MNKILIICTLLSGCGNDRNLDDLTPPKKIEKRFVNDFNNFIDISKEYGFNPSFNDIRYLETDDSIYSNDQGAVGMCYSNVTIKVEYYSPQHMEDEYIYNQIKIVSDDILLDVESNLKEVLYHELLHCIFKLEHNEENTDDIMYPYVAQSKLSADQRLRDKLLEIRDGKEENK